MTDKQSEFIKETHAHLITEKERLLIANIADNLKISRSEFANDLEDMAQKLSTYLMKIKEQIVTSKREDYMFDIAIIIIADLMLEKSFPGFNEFAKKHNVE